MDHLRQDYFRSHTKDEAAQMIKNIKDRYNRSMEGRRQVDESGSVDYGGEKSPHYDDDSPFEL